MKRLIYTILAICLALNSSAFADNGIPIYIPQAPEAQAMARAIDIPVNLYTGIPNINIPLYEIKVGDINIPISLSYHAGGIQASQEATAVGLGWHLNAGGEITRTIKGADDFMECRNGGYVEGYFDYTKDLEGFEESLEDRTTQYNTSVAQYIVDFWKNHEKSNLIQYYNLDTRTFFRDMEPDIYYFSTPCESGKMWFDHERTAHYVDKSKNIRVSMIEQESRKTSFEITDAQGNRYIYNDFEKTYIYSKSQNYSFHVNSLSNGYDWKDYRELVQEYTSSWKLSKIISTKGDTVIFKYASEFYQLPVQESLTKKTFLNYEGDTDLMTSPSSNTFHGDTYSYSKTVIDGKRLSQIIWKGGTINLEAEDRDDILPDQYDDEKPSKRIKTITIRDEDGKINKSFLFDYAYFGNEIYNSHLFKRLKLCSVKEENSKNVYTFTYDESHRFPPKNTKNTDFWGFFNGSNQGDDYVCPVVYENKCYKGGDKLPNSEFAQLGSLMSIAHPTSGVTRFVYENNQGTEKFCNYPETKTCSKNLTVKFSGVRMDTITFSQTTDVSLSTWFFNPFGIDESSYNAQYNQVSNPIFSIYPMENGEKGTMIWYRFMPSYEDYVSGQDYQCREEKTKELPAGTYIFQTECVFQGFIAGMNYEYEEMVSSSELQETESVLYGGLRIAQIQGEKNVHYEYTDGKLMIEPQLCALGIVGSCGLKWVRMNNPFDIHNFNKGGGLGACSITFLQQHSESVRPLSTFTNGNIVGYSMVEEVYDDNSKKTFFYHNETENDLYEHVSGVPTSFNWENGLLLCKYEYDSLCDLREKTENHYDCIFVNDSILGFISNGTYGIFRYCQYVHCPKLIQTIDSCFESNGLLSQTTNIEYTNNLLCSKQSVTDGTNTQTIEYKYATDFADAVSQQMVAANMVGIPIEQTTYRNGTICGKGKTEYTTEFNNGMILPKRLLVWNTDSAKYQTMVEFKDYTKYGNPVELDIKGMPVTYFWGYKGQCPIAEIKNATAQRIGNLLHCPIKSVCIDNMTVGESSLSEIRNLQKRTTEPLSITTCKFQPLVGVTELTLPTGVKTTYEYDKAGRLSKSFFGTSELHNAYHYHYADENDPENYVISSEYLNASGTDSIASIQYYDAWGRPSMTKTLGANTSGMPLYGLQTYDALGRPDKAWTPFPCSSSVTEDNFATASATAFDCDEYGYSQTEYDALGRVVKTTTPGKAWHDAGKATTCQYLTNTASEVKRYVVSGNSMTQNGFVSANTLSVTLTKDPDGHTVKTYKDMFGDVVLERRAGNIDTYFVYDDYNRLRFVLQPMYQTEASLDKFAFQYHYDGLGRVVWKKLPGCQFVSYEYDGLTDRVVKMQDGLLRVNGRTRKFEYDGLGRLTKQSIASGNTVLYDEIRNFYDDYSFLSKMEYRYMVPNNKVDKMNLSSSDSLHCFGQLAGTWQRASNGEKMLTTYCYDDYGRLNARKEIGIDKKVYINKMNYNYVGDLKCDSFYLYMYDKAKDSLSATPYHGWITHNFNNTHTKLPTSSVIHFTDGTNSMTNAVATYRYDNFGHIIANDRSGTAADMTYEYDNLHGWLTRIASSKNFEQKLYRETEGKNRRYNGSISAMTWKTDNSTLRRYDYTYDGLNRLTNADYSHFAANRSGNVSETARWIPMNDGDEGAECYSEQFQYDKNSNIKWLARWGYCSDIDGYDTSDVLDIEYNGNQKKSLVNSGFEADYYGSMQCVDGACEDVEYAYDGNGNLTRDDNKGQTYEYDLLGHPSKVNGKTYTIEYVYAPDGRKLRAVHKTYTSSTKKTVKTSTTTDYTNGYIFTNGKPTMYCFDGGYYSFDNQGKLNGCHYYIQDYQGNNREVVNASTNDIEQINHYYSYGSLMGVISTKPNAQNFKYGGKELDLSNGLNLYDFEARQYDSGAPDFTSVDHLAEKYCGISPYAYCAGDPINLIDPTGMNPIYDQHGNFLGCTSEGFTGEVIIYNGEEEFDAQSARNMTSDEFVYGSFGCAQYGLSSLCASSVEKVWNHILRQFFGKKIFLPLSQQTRQEDEEYDEDDYPEDAIFSVNDRWKVRYDRNKTGPAHWTTNLGTGNIYGSNSNVGGDYESTVENIVCSVIPHEWWGHAKKKWGDNNQKHRKCYEASMFSVWYNNTTPKYKSFCNKQYNKYVKSEKR